VTLAAGGAVSRIAKAAVETVRLGGTVRPRRVGGPRAGTKTPAGDIDAAGLADIMATEWGLSRGWRRRRAGSTAGRDAIDTTPSLVARMASEWGLTRGTGRLTPLPPLTRPPSLSLPSPRSPLAPPARAATGDAMDNAGLADSTATEWGLSRGGGGRGAGTADEAGAYTRPRFSSSLAGFANDRLRSTSLYHRKRLR